MNPSALPISEGTSNPVRSLLVGAAVPALSAVAVLAVIAAFFSAGSVGSVFVGSGMAGFALAVPPVLHQLCRNLDPGMVLGIAVLAYCSVITLLGIMYSQLSNASWLIGGFAGAGVFVVVAAWTIGQMRAAIKLRQPLYQED